MGIAAGRPHHDYGICTRKGRNLADSLMLTFMWSNLRYECDVLIVPPLCKAIHRSKSSARHETLGVLKLEKV